MTAAPNLIEAARVLMAAWEKGPPHGSWGPLFSDLGAVLAAIPKEPCVIIPRYALEAFLAECEADLYTPMQIVPLRNILKREAAT